MTPNNFTKNNPYKSLTDDEATLEKIKEQYRKEEEKASKFLRYESALPKLKEYKESIENYNRISNEIEKKKKEEPIDQAGINKLEEDLKKESDKQKELDSQLKPTMMEITALNQR